MWHELSIKTTLLKHQSKIKKYNYFIIHKKKWRTRSFSQILRVGLSMDKSYPWMTPVIHGQKLSIIWELYNKFIFFLIELIELHSGIKLFIRILFKTRYKNYFNFVRLKCNFLFISFREDVDVVRHNIKCSYPLEKSEEKVKCRLFWSQNWFENFTILWFSEGWHILVIFPLDLD